MADQGSGRARWVAIVTGALSVLIGVAYLVLITLLDSRGALLPPPPEALGGAVPVVGAAAGVVTQHRPRTVHVLEAALGGAAVGLRAVEVGVGVELPGQAQVGGPDLGSRRVRPDAERLVVGAFPGHGATSRSARRSSPATREPLTSSTSPGGIGPTQAAAASMSSTTGSP